MPDLGLEGYVPYLLYATAIGAFLASVFWRPIVGIYYFVPLIPLQTIRYRLNEFPLGASLVYILLIGVAIGLLRRRQWIVPATPWTPLLCIYIGFTFLSLCLGSLYLGSGLPWWADDRRLPDWCDYMSMLALFFLTAAAVTTWRQMKVIVLLMCVATMMLDRAFWNTVSGRDFSTYSEDVREAGTMGYAGANGLATFEAQCSTFLLAMAAFEPRRLFRFGYYGLILFSAICCMYSFSRGGYVAILAGWLFVGVMKRRKLLICLAAFGLMWTSIVPQAVISRVDMTYDQNGQLESSAEWRVKLWEDAVQMTAERPILGTGYDTYRYMKRVSNYEDTHNIYLKVLVETGAVGLVLFVWLLGKTLWNGLVLFRRGVDPFGAGLGLGLAGWVICAAAASFFGDRWTYLQIQGWFWVLAAMAARSLRLVSEGAAQQGVEAVTPEISGPAGIGTEIENAAPQW